MSLGTYADLSTALGSWGERTYATDQTDEFILLAEAEADLRLGSTYRRRTSSTINTDASGIGALPTGFISMISLTRDVLGSVPLKQVSLDALIERNPYEYSDDAIAYAIDGSNFRVSPVTDDNFLAVYTASLTGLSQYNTTNWLLTLLPNYYLFMGRAMAYAYEENFTSAAGLKNMALSLLDDLVSRDMVAEYGNVEMTLGMVTP